MMLQQAFPSRDQYFHELCETPVMSWPALAFFLVGVMILCASTYTAIQGVIPYGLAAVFNGFAIYLFFSMVHDAIHGSVCKNTRLNDNFGRISLFFLIPFAPLEISRWIHLKHHAHTACESDPDNFMHHGKWWVLPIRWAFFDVFYTKYFVKELMEGDSVARRYAGAVAGYVAVLIAAVYGFVYFGLGFELFMLWFVASRIALGLTGFVFVFLPHHPADISSHDNKFAATTVRKGWEWLLTPLMGYHNYHLIHHLYPNVPFYNHLKIWHLKYDEIIAENPALQTAFGIRPVNR